VTLIPTLVKRSILLLITVFLLLFQPYSGFTQEQSKSTIFDTNEALEFVLRTDINTLFRDREDERDYHPGSIIYKSESGEQIEVPLKLRVRGNYRRKSGVCRIPPIRLNFAEETCKGSIFEGQDKLKLVTHCQKSSKYTQYLLQEFLAYRIYNLVSDYSFKVRLVKIRYEDEAGKWKPLDSYAFIIEDEDIMSQRLKGQIKDQKNMHPLAGGFDDYQTNLLSVFEYSIGNTDWSIPGLHNVKLLEFDDGKSIIPIPYDFDWCGMVNAPYAVPNEILGLPDVRTRLYRGYKADEAVLQQVFNKFIEKKDEVFDLYQSCQALSKSHRKSSISYLEAFYRTIESPKLAKQNILQEARDLN